MEGIKRRPVGLEFRVLQASGLSGAWRDEQGLDHSVLQTIVRVPSRGVVTVGPGLE